MPCTLLTRVHLRGLLTLLAVLALVASTSVGALAQDATPAASPAASGDSAGPALGDAVVLFDDRGDEVAQMAVLAVTDPFEESTSNASRGSRYIAVEVAVQNLTDDVYEVDTFDIRVLDGEGILYNNSFVPRTDESEAATAELASVELEAGATTSGLLFYEMVDGAVPALIAYTNSYETFTLLADLREAVPAEGEATVLYDEQGEEIGTITLDESLPALEDESDSFDVGRGETVFGANVTIENTGDGALTPDLYAMYVVDEFGLLYNTTRFFRDEEESADLPDLSDEDIEAGDSAFGLVAFTLPTEVQVSYLLYIPGGQQLFVVAQLGDGSVVSGDVLTPVPVEEEETPVGGDIDETPEAAGTPVEVSAECAELTDWSDATAENLAVLEEIEVLEAASPADVAPPDLRDAAVEIRDAAEAQGEIDTPELAVDTNDAVVTFLETFADALEEGADAIEGGADPEEVFSEELLAEGSALGDATVALADASIALDETCPGIDIGLL